MGDTVSVISYSPTVSVICYYTTVYVAIVSGPGSKKGRLPKKYTDHEKKRNPQKRPHAIPQKNIRSGFPETGMKRFSWNGHETSKNTRWKGNKACCRYGWILEPHQPDVYATFQLCSSLDHLEMAQTGLVFAKSRFPYWHPWNDAPQTPWNKLLGLTRRKFFSLPFSNS